MTDPDARPARLPWSPVDTIERLREMGERPALLTLAGGRAKAVSGAELHGLVLGAANALREAGVGRGGVVAIWAPNGPGWIAAGLACHGLGAVLAPIDALLDAPAASEQAAESGAVLLLVEGARPPDLPEHIRCLDLARLRAPNEGAPASDPDPDAPIALFRTSGTTGVPKVFHLSLRNIGWSVRAIASSGHLGPADRVLMPLPLHHVFPWITATLSTLSVGGTLILPESATGPQIADALRVGRPTIIVGVPRLFEAMLAGIRARIRSRGRLAALACYAALGVARWLRGHGAPRLGALLTMPVRRAIAPGLRLLVSGGAPLPVAVEGELEALGWDVRVGYGLAETASSVAGNLTAKRRGSVGQPFPGCEVRIDAPGPEGVGEILLRGAPVFGGYINNPEANAGAFTEDGFFRTGDLGRIDEDGFLYVTGRKKEVIVLSGGDNLYPEDVEREYLADPQIGEIGVLERDGALVALIVPNLAEIAKVGATSAEDAIRVALAGVAKGLPSTWRLAGFALTRKPLPRTRLGKIRRFRLPALYDRARRGGAQAEAQPLTAEDRAWIDVPPRAEVWEILRRQHPDRPLDLESHLQLDLGLDSFGWMTLVVEIEQATGVRLEPADVAEIATVRDLLERVTARARDGGRGGPGEAEIAAQERALWLSPQTHWERLLGACLYVLNRAIIRVFFRLRVEGIGNLPASGPVLLCPNHVSDMDAFVVGAALPAGVCRRAVWAAARGRVFDTPLQRLFARLVRAFPVDDTAPAVAVELAVETLEAGRAQVWFPEGWRSPDGALLPFQPGVGLVLMRSGAPVVPVLIRGTLEALPKGRSLPRLAPVSVAFGRAVRASELIAETPNGDEQAQSIADALRRRHEALAAGTDRR